MATSLNVRDMINGCLDGILFAERDLNAPEDDDTTLDSHGYDTNSFTPDALDSVRGMVVAFAWQNRRDLREAIRHCGYDSTQAGHDYYFTTAGHGVGFWDRGLDEIGDRLTTNCGNHEWTVYSTDSDQLDLT